MINYGFASHFLLNDIKMHEAFLCQKTNCTFRIVVFPCYMRHILLFVIFVLITNFGNDHQLNVYIVKVMLLFR